MFTFINKQDFIIGSELVKHQSAESFFGKVEKIPLNTIDIQKDRNISYPFAISFEEKEVIILRKFKHPIYGAQIILLAFNLQDTPFGKKHEFCQITFPHLRNHESTAEVLLNANLNQFIELREDEDLLKYPVKSDNFKNKIKPDETDESVQIDSETLSDLDSTDEESKSDSTTDQLMDTDLFDSNKSKNSKKSKTNNSN